VPGKPYGNSYEQASYKPFIYSARGGALFSWNGVAHKEKDDAPVNQA